MCGYCIMEGRKKRKPVAKFRAIDTVIAVCEWHLYDAQRDCLIRIA